MSLNELTAHELLDQLKAGTTTPKDIYASVRQAIKQHDPVINAYVRTREDEPNFASTGSVPLPISIKDNICITGQETTCCSKILTGFKPPYNATIIDKFNQVGSHFIGTTNMDEFAFGSSTESSYYGPAKNPWNTACVPGGSSGGPAAAVAANEAIWAIGSDTGGSIRQPASFCGIVGVKPTYGRVSRYGLLAFASSLDQIGPLTKDVQDAALMLNIISGHDRKDSTSLQADVPDFTKALEKDIKGLKIGIPKEYFIEGLNPEVKAAINAAKDVLQKQGARFIDISLPHTEYAVATYYIVATAEASSNLARYDGVQYGLRCTPDKPRKSALVDMYEETRSQGFGTEAKRRIMLGTYALSAGYYDAYYLRGQKVRTLIKNDFDEAFKQVDVILTPTAPTTAFKIGEKTTDPLSMYLSDIFTISANLSGIPAMSLPCGFDKSGLPIGLQIMAKSLDEGTMLRVAFNYEQQTPWHKEKVKLS